MGAKIGSGKAIFLCPGCFTTKNTKDTKDTKGKGEPRTGTACLADRIPYHEEHEEARQKKGLAEPVPGTG